MKKTFIIALIFMLIVGSSMVFASASDYDPATASSYKQAGEPFVGTSVRLLGMGGAGLGVRGYHDSFLVNPANLAKSGFKFTLPSVTVTAYNPKAILESDLIDAIGEEDYANAASEFLNIFDIGYGDVLTTDVSTVLTIGSFGLALEMQERLMSYQVDGDSSSLNLIAQVTTAATAGLGFRIGLVPDKISIDLGVTAKAVYKGYFEAINSGIATSLIDGSKEIDEIFLSNTPLIAGYAMPISAGVNVNLPVGLTFSAAAKNFNGNYKMTTYQSLIDWDEEVLQAGLGDDDESPDSVFTSEEFEIETDWRLDAGLTWAPNIGSLIRPVLAVDVVDILSMSGLQGDDLKRAFYE
ncbi:hypothetical protein, partial [Sphaerochaeta sp. S2]|uniref:hypothetical protein n=1 Tax=Sphaerochaeta sp. S2 TaxID=2798868 RepID=UPI0018E98C61